MPEAQLPTSAAGWGVALGASLCGFVAGFLFISLCEHLRS